MPKTNPRLPQSLRDIAQLASESETPLRVSGLRGGVHTAVLAEAVRASTAPSVLVLTSGSREADRVAGQLRLLLGEQAETSKIDVFPRHDTLPYERFSPQPFVLAQRAAGLYRWLVAASSRSRATPVTVAPWTALALRVPSRDRLRAHTVHLEIGQTIDRDALCERLIASGYSRMPLVEDRGEFAVRGGILDVFPPQHDWPLRLELLGDELESIRSFDAASQRSQQTLSHAALPPPRELLFDRETVLEHADAIRDLAADTEASRGEAESLVGGLLRGHAPPGIEALASRLRPESETVFDYLPATTQLIAVDEDAGRARLNEGWEDIERDYAVAKQAGRVVAPPGELFLSPEEVLSGTSKHRHLALERIEIVDAADTATTLPVKSSDHEELRRELAIARTSDRALGPLVDRLATWGADRWRVVLACPSLSGVERLRTLLDGYGIKTHLANDSRPIWKWSKPARFEVRVADLAQGFALPGDALVVVTEEEIFGPRERRHRKPQWDEGRAVDGLAELASGDYVVHAVHGIGTYRGLLELAAGGGLAELLCIEYLGGDRLFLPVDRLNLVQRYAAGDGLKPRIDRLGGGSWERTKGRVKKSLRNMAAELLKVHASREVATGHAFSPRDAYFDEFEAGFPFEETPGQRAAIEDVLGGMQQSRPMDRIVCGDVGFGKTEVAIRAAFRAALDGKQVAILVPTTLLCQQHEATFRERFEGYPIRVESLSRFKSTAEARVIREGMASGVIDVVVGTHRLLHKNIQFRDLGLLVVDEEHRFGVAHKERVKKLKKTVDVLTLTATPIPRTLQMAFTGLRELSVIDTPPEDRYAIRTQVCRSSPELIRDAILREVQRGGQVFFVNDRVRTLDHLSELLENAVPEVRVCVAHGQMKESQLEDRMLSFLKGEFDVLLSTTIIESGLDLPRANTILINNAHAFGLAQLYQLRGRVGRGNHRAYAYLLVPPEDALSHDAQRRIEAIQDLAELGSGFRLANMDLEIRGAGNLLGAEQSGNLLAVGYDTYMEMLEETIEELRGHLREVPIDPEIRLPVTARLPEKYVPEVNQRLVLYKRLAGSGNDEDLERVRDELLDRYGPLAEEALNLLGVIRLKILARPLGIASVEIVRGEFVFQAAGTSKLNPDRLVAALQDPDLGLRVSPDHKIYAPCPPLGAGPRVLLDSAREVLLRLGGFAS
ncbi:MAG: transcription-repair coupling factor [Myxococcota bacterium]|nr:transcription-repair coupling factor [Myxococcota bacterium]